jgi:hypothetical protein
MRFYKLFFLPVLAVLLTGCVQTLPATSGGATEAFAPFPRCSHNETEVTYVLAGQLAAQPFQAGELVTIRPSAGGSGLAFSPNSPTRLRFCYTRDMFGGANVLTISSPSVPPIEVAAPPAGGGTFTSERFTR